MMQKYKSIVRRLGQHEKRLAAERDKLRDLESEIAGLADVCDEALTNLRSAIDALSGPV